MNRLTVGVLGVLAMAGSAFAQASAAGMIPVRAMPAPANATRYGNILFPGGTPQTHAGRLGATVAGVPYPSGQHSGGGGGRGRTTVVPYAVPVFAGGYGMGYGMQQQQPVTVVVPQQPPPQVIINHHYNSPDGRPEVTAETAAPRGELQVYEASPRKPQPARTDVEPRTYVRDEKPNVYMIALKDNTVREAIGFWVTGDTLNYVTPEATIHHVSLDMVDRSASKQLNDQRKLELELPLR